MAVRDWAHLIAVPVLCFSRPRRAADDSSDAYRSFVVAPFVSVSIVCFDVFVYFSSFLVENGLGAHMAMHKCSMTN